MRKIEKYRKNAYKNEIKKKRNISITIERNYYSRHYDSYNESDQRLYNFHLEIKYRDS